jgi:cytochrome c-type biogenesis protein CcmH
MRGLRALLVVGSVVLSPPALAVQPDEILSDPKLETRARALSRELRCMVCQNQSIDDSDAPLARDLRLLVRERLVAGDSDEQVTAFLTARYGEFVLLKPRFGWNTALLWITPGVAFAIGGVALIAFLRRRQTVESTGPAEPPLSDAERMRVAELAGDRRNPLGPG